MRSVPALTTSAAPRPHPNYARWSHASREDASKLFAPRGGALPVEIAFLAPDHCTLGALVAAADEARRLSMCPRAVLLASGAITDDEYYAALARRLGLPFSKNPEPMGPGPGSPQAALAGVAPLSSGASHMLMAPEGPAVAALLQMRQRGGLPNGRIILTTPRRFAAWARRSAAKTIAAEASTALARYDPALSASSGLSRLQILLGVALSGGALAALFLSALAWFVVCQCLAFVMAMGVLLRLMATFGACNERRRQARRLRDASLPIYTIIAPLYREEQGAAKLVAALERLDYPRAKLDIKIVVEAEDIATREAFEALDLPVHFEIIVAPPGAPRTKPRALNIALPFARGALTTIYDAEDEPEREQLRLAAERFADAPADVACLQV